MFAYFSQTPTKKGVVENIRQVHGQLPKIRDLANYFTLKTVFNVTSYGSILLLRKVDIFPHICFTLSEGHSSNF
jgi:hypothetical protein